jgi:hypothetical protein
VKDTIAVAQIFLRLRREELLIEEDYSCVRNFNVISKFNGKYNFKILLKLTLLTLNIDLLHLQKLYSYGIKQILVGHFISAIVFVVFSLFAGDNYTIDHVLNGKKDDPILISERYVEQLPAYIKTVSKQR